jgi:hypothetical protein
MIDTNQVQQAADTAQAVKQQVEINWTAICAACLWLRTELKAFNAWARVVLEYGIQHGGVLKMAAKFFYNKNA